MEVEPRMLLVVVIPPMPMLLFMRNGLTLKQVTLPHLLAVDICLQAGLHLPQEGNLLMMLQLLAKT